MFPITRHRVQFLSRRLFAALTGIIGISLFISRADADSAAPASTEVQWPAGYAPRNADLFTHDEIVIHASPSTVWDYLVAAEQWPSWYSNSQNVKILNSEHILRRGSTFTWTSFGVRLQSVSSVFVAFVIFVYCDYSAGLWPFRIVMFAVNENIAGLSKMVQRDRTTGK